METIETLESTIQLLLCRMRDLAEENRKLKNSNEEQRKEIIRSHGEINDLRNKMICMQTAHAMTGSAEQRLKAKEKLTRMIVQVDRAIASLKED